MLDLTRLECVKHRHGKTTAACPACREAGGDKAGEHLAVFDSGAYHCAADSGDAHNRRIFELVGIRRTGSTRHIGGIIAPIMTSRASPRRVASKPRLPELRPLNVTEMARIAEMRRWPSFAGFELLTLRGLLFHGLAFDGGAKHPAWIVTDATRRNAQARRLDGQPWQGIGGAKAKTLAGTQASWPVGLEESRHFPHIMLCEGTPDFAAALLVAWWGGYAAKVAPVMLSGTGQSIPADAYHYFTGKPVTICQHADADPAKGPAAAQRWAAQLRDAGAAPIQFAAFGKSRMADGTPCKDLADFATTLRLPEPDERDAAP